MAYVAYTPSNIPTGLPFCGRLSPAGMGGLRGGGGLIHDVGLLFTLIY